MKKLKLIAGALFLSSFLFSACDGLLDTTPKQSIDAEEALTNAENVKSVLIGAYDAIGGGDLYGGWFLMIPDFLAANDEFDFSGTFFSPRQIRLKEQEYDNGNVASTWIDAYDAINIANSALDGLDLLEGSERDRVEGEAKFIRGMIYFDLVRLYAPQYVTGGPNDQAGVPLVLTPTRSIDESSNIARSTVGEVYDQVISDLTDAKDLLPDVNPERSYYANSMVASAVLSRVYLQMEDYDNARLEADRVISSQNYSLTGTYADAFNNVENSSEDIFSMQVSAQDGVNSMFTFYSADSRGDIDINQAHIDEYEAGDDRLDLFYNDPSDGVLRSGKWNDGVNGNVQQIRLAEMYLTRAEANYREGTPYVGADPIDDLNEIRDRVNLPLYVLPTEFNLDDILLERKLELMFEGQLLHDIKRTQGTVGTRNYDDPKLVLPIPRREIDANPSLCQNASYQGPAC
ncbi:MAG: RagB/SusD family nutrient uptake outer membrane protein [Gracilimonas sp.]|uniref:RagB/SusD family nutrient uptake outer membrane protein n=1 Tax=Gracilimonas sp. TaxID=1974203 RepID=UPI00198CDCDF|nr:RagB/SusD family nutrient uptake outer membrane protein [Gracilimonas sp.]MBD3617775.1 RagB/SusD family nutrient uptake outer membrane protein [Gracilimonas sp.]